MADRIVLASSAGVDPGPAVAALGAGGDREVIALVVDVGGRAREVEAVRRRAREAGAVDALVVDAKAEFATEHVVAAIRANADPSVAPLVPALRRPLVAGHLVRTARQLGAAAVAHHTAYPDHVALVTTVAAIDPDLAVIAVPALDPDAATGPMSEVEQDLWGRVLPTLALDDPWAGPGADDWARTQDPDEHTPADEVTITFEHGVPVALDGQRFTVVRLLQELDALAGRHGIGRTDLVEDLVDGRKVRRVTETPAATTLVTAHRDLERLTLEPDVQRFKRGVDTAWADTVRDGRWGSGLHRGLDAFVEHTQQHVSGDVRLRLHGGAALVTGRRSPQSLYDYELATASTTRAPQAASGAGAGSSTPATPASSPTPSSSTPGSVTPGSPTRGMTPGSPTPGSPTLSSPAPGSQRPAAAPPATAPPGSPADPASLAAAWSRPGRTAARRDRSN